MIADRISVALDELAVDRRLRADAGRVALSHLVARERGDDYRRRALAQAGEGYRVVVDGPRAPYSFVRFSAGRGIIESAPASTA